MVTTGMQRVAVLKSIDRIKHYCRIAMHFDKRARRYATFVTLGLILRFLRV